MNEIISICNNKKENNNELKSSWGLSFLIKIDGQNILFDTGSNGDELIYNLMNLNIDMEDIKKVVISHDHWDHKGGLEHILKRNLKSIDIYYPKMEDKLKSSIYAVSKNVHFVDKPEKITDCVHILGTFGSLIKEQCIVLDTHKGLILLVGCAHPGIVKMSKKIKTYFNKNIYAVFGGFHLEHYPNFMIKLIVCQLKRIGVEKIGPSHCTGEKAIKLFKDVYRNNFVEMNLGDKFTFS